MKLPGENSVWLSLAGALVVGVVVLVGFGISGLRDLPERPGPPRDAPPVQTVGTTPQERAAALTASATADATQVARYNADVTAWATERANRRTASFALLAGAVALLTAAVGAAAHAETVRKNRADAKGAAATRADERFATAIEHLSSDQRGVRIGGIYSLEALAREDRDRIETVVQILLAFAEPWWVPAREWVDVPQGPEPYPAPGDVRLAFEAAARTRTSDEIVNFDLSCADLTGAALGGADLRDANLRGAILTGADLRLAQLDEAQLQHANLTRVKFEDAHLTGARLDRAILKDADFSHAKLQGARFKGAHLEAVDLRAVDLRGVTLRHVDFAGSNLEGVDLSQTDLDHSSLLGAFGIGTHPSHRQLDFGSLMVQDKASSLTSEHAGKIGVIEETRFVDGDSAVRLGGPLQLGIRFPEHDELVWLSNGYVRREKDWQGPE